ncbi:MAG: MarR family transcriptional regulator [Ignavibacteriales bacterium]|nr:MarR family transcriptional regulator [Ignavibacteriales bacterium]
MKLEQEIKQQKPFKTEHERAVVNILFTASWLQSYSRDFLKQYDISSQQYNILRILRGQFPKSSTVNLLKERMLDKMSDASRLIDRLLKRELVERTICPTDRRAVDIFITKKGLELLKRIDKERDDIDAMLERLSAKEMKQLNELLDKLRG